MERITKPVKRRRRPVKVTPPATKGVNFSAHVGFVIRVHVPISTVTLQD